MQLKWFRREEQTIISERGRERDSTLAESMYIQEQQLLITERFIVDRGKFCERENVMMTKFLVPHRIPSDTKSSKLSL